MPLQIDCLFIHANFRGLKLDRKTHNYAFHPYNNEIATIILKLINEFLLWYKIFQVVWNVNKLVWGNTYQFRLAHPKVLRGYLRPLTYCLYHFGYRHILIINFIFIFGNPGFQGEIIYSHINYIFLKLKFIFLVL